MGGVILEFDGIEISNDLERVLRCSASDVLVNMCPFLRLEDFKYCILFIFNL